MSLTLNKLNWTQTVLLEISDYHSGIHSSAALIGKVAPVFYIAHPEMFLVAHAAFALQFALDV